MTLWGKLFGKKTKSGNDLSDLPTYWQWVASSNPIVSLNGVYALVYRNERIWGRLITGQTAKGLEKMLNESASKEISWSSILDGYTGLIPADQIGNSSILPGTFYNGSDNFVTGKYKVYLVAYRSSFLEYPDMNFFLPGGLPANNISGANGTIGAGVVVYYDSLRAE